VPPLPQYYRQLGISLDMHQRRQAKLRLQQLPRISKRVHKPLILTFQRRK